MGLNLKGCVCVCIKHTHAGMGRGGCAPNQPEIRMISHKPSTRLKAEAAPLVLAGHSGDRKPRTTHRPSLNLLAKTRKRVVGLGCCYRQSGPGHIGGATGPGGDTFYGTSCRGGRDVR